MPPKGFRCTHCGECCYPPRLNREDASRLKKAGLKEFIATNPFGHSYIREHEESGRCIFLGWKGALSYCKIYKSRPKICREYPRVLINGDCRPQALKSDVLFRWEKK
ncbi:TPA: YkgJ family cysteine cluster protein [Candidatus Woesearchaeota archaeon]|nr:YkgJ family cysteine cluster protein [Candidatus Woesearchaeota archaeon]HII69223.1 YkgJ family cysteine cluster protein [Candidatus Woesearchaeota archaeon]